MKHSPQRFYFVLLVFLVRFTPASSILPYFCPPDEAYIPPLKVSNPTAFNGTVVIVGGGAAGMFAAYTLDYLGVKYQLLEANSVVGGRVQELVGFADVPLDLGAEWIHVHPKVLQDLLLYNDKVTEETFFWDIKTLSIYKWGRIRKRNAARLFRWREFKFRNTTWHSYLTDYVYPYISNKTVTGAVVETIDYSLPNVIKVKTKDGREFPADRVIVATPVTILQQNDITFTPALPAAKQKAIGAVDMPAGLKAWIEFDKRFYPDELDIWAVEEKTFFDALFHKGSNRNILALLEVSDTAYDDVKLTDDQIHESIMKELDHMFGGKATAHYIQHHIKNWSAEPYIKGAYSFNRYKKDRIVEPVDGRLYFCGEYTVTNHQSTVHGAAMSGRAAAQQVLLDAQAK